MIIRRSSLSLIKYHSPLVSHRHRNMSSYRFLVGSESSHISLLSFDASAKAINLVSQSVVDKTPTWVEAAAQGQSAAGKSFYSLSEEGGKVVSLELQGDKLEITARAATGGNPAHVHALRDGSGVIATNYVGGTAAFYPTDGSTGHLAAPATLASAIPTAVSAVLPQALKPPAPTPLLKFHFPYADRPSGKGPFESRQDSSHPHQCIEDGRGNLYVPDLGSDRIWVIRREGEVALRVIGELRLPEGSGPRHAVISEDDKHLYVLSELTHAVYTFKLPEATDAAAWASPVHPIDSKGAEIVPPAVPADLRPKMTAGELLRSPAHAKTLYASNRGQVDLGAEAGGVAGDALAVVTLAEDGASVSNVEITQTSVNFIRGMGVSADGKYVIVVGQKDGAVAVYETQGEKGEKIELVASLSGDKSGLEGPTDVTFV